MVHPITLLLGALGAFAQTDDHPVRAVTDPGVVTTRQSITPAGVPAIFQGKIHGVDFGANASEVWVLGATAVYRLNWRENKVLEQIPLGGTPGLQSIRYDASSGRAIATSATAAGNKTVRVGALSGGRQKILLEDAGRFLAGALDIARTKSIAVVPMTYNNELAVVDLESGARIATAKTHIAPFAAVVDAAGTAAWVSNWGGRLPQPKDLTAPTGLDANADRVVVDEKGAAAGGSVVRIDLASSRITDTIAVAPHPTALAWDRNGERLYVAHNNRGHVSVIDTRTRRLLRTIAIQPFRERVAGVAPTAVVLSADAKTLFVACGGINAVARVNTETGRVDGMIPTAWYPNSLAISADGRHLAIGSLLGAGSGWQNEPRRRFVHSYRGAVHVVDLPDATQLASYTTAVAENNHLTLGPPQPAPPPDRNKPPVAIPARAGERSHIEHVVYIIKENRTYDQVFGDLRKGNGDPSLVMFGADVTPNHHKLAEQFVLLDNFYATGGNSANGHQWVTQANETAYTLWPGYLGRSYPFDGTDPIAIAEGGLLWDAALGRGLTARIYGEYAGRLPDRAEKRQQYFERWKKGESFEGEFQITAPIASMNKVLARNFPPYSLAIPDVVRSRIFVADVRKWEAAGKMPNLVVILLPSDHTFGASPGASSAKAMVADNDLALGQVVEALTKTQFWKKMAIFVVEDDAQNGVDHVDGHRTVALVASPYARRGAIDSTFYSHQSMVKTIGLILGLPALSLFDLIANDMRPSFTNTPDFGTFDAVAPSHSLDERNPPMSALKGAARRAARDSAKMRWDVPDAAPSDRLNRILWGQVRGWDTPFPGVKQAVFAPLSLDIDDEEREEK